MEPIRTVLMTGRFRAHTSSNTSAASIQLPHYDTQYKLTVNNVGTTNWWGTIYVHEIWTTSGNPNGTTSDEVFVFGSASDYVAGGASVTKVFQHYILPANSGPVTSGTFYCNGGPLVGSPGTASVGSYTILNGGNTLGQPMTLNVNTLNVAPCTTNLIAAIPDNAYTNQIAITETNNFAGQTPVTTWTAQGPLSGLTWTFYNIPCPVTGSYSITESNIPPCYGAPVAFNVTNSASTWRIMGVGVNYTNMSFPTILDEQLIAPGGDYYYTNTLPCGTDTSGYHLYASGITGDDNLADTGITNMYQMPTNSLPSNYPTNDLGPNIGGQLPGPGSGGTPTQLTNQPAPLLNVSNYSQFPQQAWETNPIVWSMGTNNDILHVTSAVQDSGQALYNAAQTGIAQAHADAAAASSQAHADANAGQAQQTANAQQQINQAAGGAAQAHADSQAATGTAAAAAGLAHADSSALAAGVSNLGVDISSLNKEATQQKILGGVGSANTNLAAMNGTLAGISNLLAGAGQGTNNYSGTNYSIYTMDASMTNAAAAETLAQTVEDMTGIGNLVSAITPSLPDSSPAPVDMTMQFCGRTINLDPVIMFPSAVAVSFNGFTIVALLGFFAGVGRLYWRLIQVKASAQVGGTPDMDVEIAGFGGNALGFIVGRLVSFAFIALFAAASVYLFSNLGVSIGDALNFTNWTGSMGGIGLYLLTSFIPVHLICSLAATYLLLTFTLAKLLNLAVAASRFLIGR